MSQRQIVKGHSIRPLQHQGIGCTGSVYSFHATPWQQVSTLPTSLLHTRTYCSVARTCMLCIQTALLVARVDVHVTKYCMMCKHVTMQCTIPRIWRLKNRATHLCNKLEHCEQLCPVFPLPAGSTHKLEVRQTSSACNTRAVDHCICYCCCSELSLSLHQNSKALLDGCIRHRQRYLLNWAYHPSRTGADLSAS